MAETVSTEADPPAPESAGGATIFGIGGLAAALGAASCCALPLVLGGVGVSSAWLAGLAEVAAPYQAALQFAAVGSVAAGAALLWRRRVRARACVDEGACRTSVPARLAVISLSLAAVLVVLSYVTA